MADVVSQSTEHKKNLKSKIFQHRHNNFTPKYPSINDINIYIKKQCIDNYLIKSYNYLGVHSENNNVNVIKNVKFLVIIFLRLIQSVFDFDNLRFSFRLLNEITDNMEYNTETQYHNSCSESDNCQLFYVDPRCGNAKQ